MLDQVPGEKTENAPFFVYLFPSKRIEIVARVQVESGTMVWTILIRQKRQEGNLLTRLGLLSRLPQVSQVHRERGGASILKKKNYKAQCHPC